MLLVVPSVATRHHLHVVNVPYVLGKFKLASGTANLRILTRKIKNKVKHYSHPNFRL
jgi:hypothetical protein